MPLNFVKMHANGDDFVLIDARGRDNPITRELAKALGDRRRGIGFNQLVVLGDCHESAAQLTFFNADGSSLNTCGSATRGAADLLMQNLDGAPLADPRIAQGQTLCCAATPFGEADFGKNDASQTVTELAFVHAIRR